MDAADSRSHDASRSAAALLLLGALACAVAAWMYVQENGGFERGAAFHTWERSLFAAAVILTAIGFVLFEDALQISNGHTLARIGANGYFFAAILLLAGEALALTIGWDQASVLISVYVVLAYLAEACIGGALLQSRMTATWVAWATLMWNLGWLLALGILGGVAGYIPLVHHLMPFFIGIGLLWKTPRDRSLANSTAARQ